MTQPPKITHQSAYIEMEGVLVVSGVNASPLPKLAATSRQEVFLVVGAFKAPLPSKQTATTSCIVENRDIFETRHVSVVLGELFFSPQFHVSEESRGDS